MSCCAPAPASPRRRSGELRVAGYGLLGSLVTAVVGAVILLALLELSD